VASDRLVIGSRGSKLALWQANYARDRLKARYAGLEVEVRVIKTLGDKVRDVALSKLGSKGIFTKELEEAILSRKIDLAVHSLKDLPTKLPEGLVIGAVTERIHTADCLVSREAVMLKNLTVGARIGTSSLRRKVQICAIRPDLEVKDLRGNLDTRLAKLERGEFEAIVVAQAGLVRLGLEDRITEVFRPEVITPAAGQGALAFEYRDGDRRTGELVSFLNHRRTELEIEAERDFLRALGGGCQVPIGASAKLGDDRRLLLYGMISDLQGERLMRDGIEDFPGARPGKMLAERMLDSGGREILEEILGGE